MAKKVTTTSSMRSPVAGSISSPKWARLGWKLVGVRQPQHRTCDGRRFGARETHYTNAAASGRSGDGDDGVIEVHENDYSPQSVHHRGTEKAEHCDASCERHWRVAAVRREQCRSVDLAAECSGSSAMTTVEDGASLRMTFRAFTNSLPPTRRRGLRRGWLAGVVLGIDHDVALQCFAGAFGAQIGNITQGQMHQTALAR